MILAQIQGEPSREDYPEFGASTISLESTDETWWVMLHVDPESEDPFAPMQSIFKGKRLRVTIEVID